jgi:hypothetical protein
MERCRSFFEENYNKTFFLNGGAYANKIIGSAPASTQ